MAHESTSITLVRSFDVPVERVFSAWLDPELMRAWMCPRTYEMCEVDARARMGGRYRITLANSRDEHHVTHGEYIEIVPNRRIIQTWVTEHPDKHPGNHQTTLFVEFQKTPAGAGTEIRLHHDNLRTGVDQARVRRRWTECLDRLEQLFDGLGANDLAAPVPPVT